MKTHIISALCLAFSLLQVQADTAPAAVVVDGEPLPMAEGDPAPAILLKELDSLGMQVSGLPQEETVTASETATPEAAVPVVVDTPAAEPNLQEEQPEMMQAQIISYVVSFIAILAVIGILYYARRVKREELPPPPSKE